MSNLETYVPGPAAGAEVRFVPDGALGDAERIAGVLRY